MSNLHIMWVAISYKHIHNYSPSVIMTASSQHGTIKMFNNVNVAICCGVS